MCTCLQAAVIGVGGDKALAAWGSIPGLAADVRGARLVGARARLNMTESTLLHGIPFFSQLRLEFNL